MKRATRAVTFRSILCPVDFSTHSRDAVQYAVGAARRLGGRVTVMFVNDPLLLAAAGGGAKGRRQFVEDTRRELARFVKRAMPSGPALPDGIALLVSTGNAADEILGVARRLRSDLIVIGTHGLSGVHKLFFGSTTEQVLRRAGIPVLAIPPSKPKRRESTDTMAIRRVVAPIDLAGEWQSDAIRAADVARALDAELLLVHVLPRIQRPPWVRSDIDSIDRRRTEKARRALERARTTLSSHATSTSRVLVGNPADEIARLTTGPPSLVVMALRGGAGLWGARRGSIAYHVLTHSRTPVLALPRRRLGGPFSTRIAHAVFGVLSARDRIEMAGIDALFSTGSTRTITHRRRSRSSGRRVT